MAKTRTAVRSAIALAGVSLLALTACTGPSGGTSSGNSAAASGPITVGTTDKVTFLDPAGSYDNGSFMVMNQIYPFLLNSKPGSAEPQPDIATSASFTSPTEYTVKLKSGLKWANGDTLDSADVKFSFDRQVKINDPNGPASLLENLASVDAPDPSTVVFHLKQGNDQTFPQVLTGPVGPIVDHKVFPADKVMNDEDIVSKKAFAGPYTISSYQKNQLVSFKANSDYQGLLGKPATDTVNLKYYSDSNNLKLDVQQGNIDVAWRSLAATDVDSLSKDSKVAVHKGPGGEIRYIVFNFDTMPYGAKAPDADPAKSLAVRQAMADLVDREAIASQVYKGTYTPLYSYVPDGFLGAATPLKAMYGDGNGKPSADKAKKALTDAGITTPVTLNLQYNPDHYGKSSGDEYALVKQQLEAGGLFKVNLQSTEWVTYSKDRTKDVYPMYQLGWFPDFSDSDNYLTPFFTANNFLKNHYSNKTVQDLISKEATNPDKNSRAQQIGQIQDDVAKDLSTLPLLQGAQVAVAGTSVKGVDSTLDPSFKFRLGVLSK
ncbi:peptide ABC transporter substrate-binding protein [Sinomonas cellulolyticus]|jgi:peptide/nickel transport system substrate-binding protein|uniref:Peptide ABC transporter substrate-binding protein n=1 Tax=Sinomonas cellulolyticus TaxID=2801916 RepID=A0ABS1K1T9_9MICC|nr:MULTISPECIES: ABC transporter substrate-binding protein [Sinomonas]MBL0704877.1 peptide ABC transporter substrate-binding protein [Sinomonas cellulolyticus]GHG47559.1 peptide ABC transporter substrate-binding protein [Sinomonas sp. KCTC 49339]